MDFRPNWQSGSTPHEREVPLLRLARGNCWGTALLVASDSRREIRRNKEGATTADRGSPRNRGKRSWRTGCAVAIVVSDIDCVAVRRNSNAENGGAWPRT